jgi:hypothetical protein
MFCTTLLFKRVVEADLQTVQQQSFSHLKPTRQGRSAHPERGHLLFPQLMSQD